MKHSNNGKEIGIIPLVTASGAVWGLISGLLTAVAFLILNPSFIDSFTKLFFWFVLIPAVAGLFFGLLFGLLSRLLSGGDDGPLPTLATIGLGLIIVGAVALSGIPLGLGLSPVDGAAGSVLLSAGLLALAGLGCAWFVLRRNRSTTPRRQVFASSLSLALVALLIFAAFWPLSAFLRAEAYDLSANAPKILTIGLDGLSPVILERMTARGELPTFKSMMDQGCFGELTSLTPIFSPMIWTSIATGKLPDKHGVQDFLNASYLDIKAKTVWEVMEEEGGKTGLYEWLCTWPPVKLNGFVVPGWLARNTLTYPASLQFVKEIKTAGRTGGEQSTTLELGRSMLQAVRHGATLTSVTDLGALYLEYTICKPSRNEIHNRLYLVALGIDSDVFEYLLATEQPEYAFYYHQIIDPICHNYWQFYEPEGFDNVTDRDVASFRGVIEDTYREMDRRLARLFDRLGPETLAMVISDHGFQSLVAAPDSMGLLVNIRADELLDSLGIDDLEGFHTMAQLFLTAQTEDEARVGQILGQAAASLKTYWVPDVDMPLFRPELIDNPGTNADYVKLSLNIDLKPAFEAGQIGEAKTIIRHENGECLLGDLVWQKFSSGVHHIEGVIMARGPGIRRGVRLAQGESSVLDVAPTLLAMAGIPVAEDMDGKVLYELFDAGTITPESVRWIESYGDGTVKKPIVGQVDGEVDDGLRSKLEELGYIDG